MSPPIETTASAPKRPLWRRVGRLVWRLVVLLLVLGALWGVLALVLSRIPVNDDWKPAENGVEVWVLSNGVHTDFIVPARTQAVDWSQTVPREAFEEVGVDFQYVEIGWGDRGFYLEVPDWEHLTVRVAVAATLGLDGSAVHVTWLRWPPKEEESLRRLVLTEPQYRDLRDFLLASFARDASGRAIPIAHPGYTKQDRFFESTGSYNLVRTCNAWTGEGLRKTGVKTGLWTPFAGDVLRFLARCEPPCAE